MQGAHSLIATAAQRGVGTAQSDFLAPRNGGASVGKQIEKLRACLLQVDSAGKGKQQRRRTATTSPMEDGGGASDEQLWGRKPASIAGGTLSGRDEQLIPTRPYCAAQLLTGSCGAASWPAPHVATAIAVLSSCI